MCRWAQNKWIRTIRSGSEQVDKNDLVGSDVRPSVLMLGLSYCTTVDRLILCLALIQFGGGHGFRCGPRNPQAFLQK